MACWTSSETGENFGVIEREGSEGNKLSSIASESSMFPMGCNRASKEVTMSICWSRLGKERIYD